MSPANEHLDPDKIKVNTKRIGRKIIVYNHTSSTNDVAAEYAKNKENDGLAIFAEEQTAGRGRTGAKWLSGHSDSILCSILLTSCKCNPELLSLACPVAVSMSLLDGLVLATSAFDREGTPHARLALIEDGIAKVDEIAPAGVLPIIRLTSSATRSSTRGTSNVSK